MLALACMVGPPVVAGMVARRRWLADWNGAPGVLVHVVLSLALLLLGAHAVGAVGLLAPLPLVLVGGLEVAAVAWAARRWPNRRQERIEDPPPASERWAEIAAVMVVGLLAAQWASRLIQVVQQGIIEYDSLHYHLTHAARFVQTGWLTRLHHVNPDGVPTSFHPADSEVLHAIGMEAFGRDILSPFINVGWLALLLLAAWCVGRPRGAGPVSLIGAAVILAMPLTAISAGSALTDVASYACFISTVALLLQPGLQRTQTLGGVAAGLALSMKLTMAVPITAVTVGLVVLARRGDRVATATRFIVPMVITGSFWYLRNLATVGSPLPTVRIGPLPVWKDDLDSFATSVASYVHDGQIWREWFVPGLATAMSPLWWAIVAAVAAAAVLAWRERDRRIRMLGAVIVATVGAYVFTPTTAAGDPGRPIFFAVNLRYVFPGVLLALVLLPVLIAGWSRGRRAALGGVFLVLFGSTQLAGRAPLKGIGHLPAWGSGNGTVLVAAMVGVAVVVGVIAVVRLRPARTTAATLVAAVLAVAGFAVQDRYERNRYRANAVWSWAVDLEDQRIGVDGINLQYPYVGRTLTNHVEHLGRLGSNRFSRAASCDEWRRLLADGRFDYVVVDPRPEGRFKMAWMASNPNAVQVAATHEIAAFRMLRPNAVASCG